MKRLLLYIVTMLLVLSSCEREIEYDGEVTKPKLVLQAEVSEGFEPVRVYVSHSHFFLNSKSNTSAPFRTSDVVVEIQYGDEPWQTMTYNEKRGYFIVYSDIYYEVRYIKAGDIVRIRASHPGYDTITAEQKVVPKPNLLMWLVFRSQETVLHSNNSQQTIEVSLAEPSLRLMEYPSGDVILGLNVSCTYHMTYMIDSRVGRHEGTTTYIQSHDQLFASGENDFSAQNGYSTKNELFFKPGYPNNYNVKIQIPVSIHGSEVEVTSLTIDTLVISFNAHSRDSYLYRRSMYLAHGGKKDNEMEFDLGAEISGLFGQEENVQIYSNIENGYGIFAACSRGKIIMTNIKVLEQ